MEEDFITLLLFEFHPHFQPVKNEALEAENFIKNVNFVIKTILPAPSFFHLVGNELSFIEKLHSPGREITSFCTTWR
jgi:hypothetical protein